MSADRHEELDYFGVDCFDLYLPLPSYSIRLSGLDQVFFRVLGQRGRDLSNQRTSEFALDMLVQCLSIKASRSFENVSVNPCGGKKRLDD
jgi:hypothetical protein